MNKIFYILTIFFLTSAVSCSKRYEMVSEDRFIGIWELEGRGAMLDGIQVKIESKNGKLIGRIKKLNENRIVKLFADSNDVWVSRISRNSNFQFTLSEKKIGQDLFSLYDLNTTQEYKVEFIDDNTIGLGSGDSNPLNSKNVYKRIH